jgi:hypothetical protein
MGSPCLYWGIILQPYSAGKGLVEDVITHGHTLMSYSYNLLSFGKIERDRIGFLLLEFPTLLALKAIHTLCKSLTSSKET